MAAVAAVPLPGMLFDVSHRSDDGDSDSLGEPFAPPTPPRTPDPRRFAHVAAGYGPQARQWRFAHDALNGVCFAAFFALHFVLPFDVMQHEAKTPYVWLIIIAVLEMFLTAMAAMGALVEDPSAAFGRDFPQQVFRPRVALMFFPGVVIAPFYPLLLLAARLHYGAKYDLGGDDACAPDFATAAAAEVLGTAPQQCVSRPDYCWHQRLLLRLRRMFLFNLLVLVIFGFTLPPEAMLQWALLAAAVVLLFPPHKPCATTDDATYCFFLATGWHDGLAFFYVVFTVIGVFDFGRDFDRNAAQRDDNRWLVLWCLASAAGWTAVVGIVGGVAHWLTRPFPLGCTVERDNACGLLFAVPLFFVWHICGKAELLRGALDWATGDMMEARKWVAPLWRFARSGLDELRSVEGEAAADREYAERLRAVAVVFIEESFANNDDLTDAVQPPSEAAARDGAAHVMQQPAVADAVTAAKARCYAEVWTMCAQPEYQYRDIINMTDRCDVLMPDENVNEAKVVRHTGVFAQRAILYLPPMLMWVCVPFYVAYTSRAALSGPHIAMLVALLLSLLTSVALSPRVARFARFCLCVAPLRNLCRDTAADVLGTRVANLVTQYLRVQPHTMLRAIVEPGVLPAAVLRDHVAPLMDDAVAMLAVLTASECAAMNRDGQM
jgi:hypothetical protein